MSVRPLTQEPPFPRLLLGCASVHSSSVHSTATLGPRTVQLQGPGGRDCGTRQPACQCRPAFGKAHSTEGNNDLGKCWERNIEWGKQSTNCMYSRSRLERKSMCESEMTGGKTNQTWIAVRLPLRLWFPIGGTFGNVWGHRGCHSWGGGAAGF